MTEAVLELRNNRLVWYATCPDGCLTPAGKVRRTSNYIGEQKDFDGQWYITFRCKGKDNHTFNAPKPKNAPRNSEEVRVLMNKLLLAKAAEKEQGTKKR